MNHLICGLACHKMPLFKKFSSIKGEGEEKQCFKIIFRLDILGHTHRKMTLN